MIRKRASRNVWNKNFACAGQLIITTPIQAVKLPTTTVTRFKIAFSLWPKLIRTVESEILAIKKTVKTYIQLLELYSVILNVPIKHVQEKWKGKEIWLWKKKNILLSQLLFNCNIEKQRYDSLCQFCFLTLYLFWLKACIFDFFIWEYTSRSWTDKSETLGKLRKHRSLWWKSCAG